MCVYKPLLFYSLTKRFHKKVAGSRVNRNKSGGECLDFSKCGRTIILKTRGTQHFKYIKNMYNMYISNNLSFSRVFDHSSGLAV